MQFPIQIIQELIISYPTGSPAIQIGPGPLIEFFDTNGNVVTSFSPTAADWINSSNTGMIEIVPDGGPVTGIFPGIYFFNALTAGNYQNAAYIQSNPDFNGNAQIGINNGPFFSVVHPGVTLRQRIFLEGQVAGPGVAASQIGPIDINTQALYGGQYYWDDGQANIGVFTNGTATNHISVQTGNTFSDVPIQVGSWANVSFGAGWSNFGGGYSNAQWRLCSDGFVHFRGLVTIGAAPADNTLVFAIPLSAQPPASKETALLRINGVSAGTPCRMNITVGGGQVNFSIFGAGTGTNFSLEDMFYESSAYMA